ncbi:hypothetical protein [Chondrinema litorale]|uniref:hypothetical protein n=1 Tax=Chondrinema litorale TaxID=2994555 RepID=UPI002542F960|nr:hypothetical protein [Chondrinema litorale]UZR95886.1 hypothetical protein OQ292_08675 [Chondrinema litorale]
MSFLFSFLCAHAQPNLTTLKEIPLQENMEFYQFIKFDDGNYALVLKEYHDLGKNPVLRVYLIDDELEIKSQNFYPVSPNTQIANVTNNSTNIIILLNDESKYTLINIDYNDSSEFNELNVDFPEKLDITHLAVSEFTVFFGGIMEGKTTGYKFDMENETTDILFHHIRESTTIKSIELNKNKNVASFVLQSGNETSIQNIYLNNYDSHGRILFNTKVSIPLGYNISDFRLGVIDQSSYLIVGEYSLTYRPDENVAGFFSMKLKERDIESSRFYDLSRLKSFYKYLPEKDEMKQRKRLSKASAKMQTIKTKIDVELQKFEQYDKRFMLLASSFEKAKTLDKSYKYTYLNTVALGFDEAGRMVWDNAITYPNENLSNFTPFMLTDAEYYQKNVFFIQKRQYIYRYKNSDAGSYSSNIKEVYLNDGFLDVKLSNVFFEEKVELTGDGNMLYYGVREVCDKKDLINSSKYFFIEKIEANPRPLLTKGEN